MINFKLMKHHIHHLHIFILIGAVIFVLLFLTVNFVLQNYFFGQSIQFGVSYSPGYASYLGLDPHTTYTDILETLDVKLVRLSAYWDQIEPEPDRFDFTELDSYIDEAEKNQAKIILAVGYKLPRWPECRAPRWIQYTSLRQRQLKMVEEVVSYYSQNPTILAFQLENEPLLKFGLCPKPDRDFLKKEVESIKSITKKPIIITDSGELRSWVTPMKLSDIFGTTIYRKVGDPIFGQLYYPLPPWFYKIKSDIIRGLFASTNQETIISELQAEPWVNRAINEIPTEEQAETFTLSDLNRAVNYSKKTGFSEIVLWGVEWWYYMAMHGHPEYLEFAKTLFP